MTINSSFRSRICVSSIALVAAVAVALAGGSAAQAAESPVYLYTADSYAVLAGSAVTNTGPTVITGGDLGLSPGTAITGFPPGIIVGGTTNATNAAAVLAQDDLTTAYNDAAGRSPLESNVTELGNRELIAGTYRDDGGSMGLTGTVTLNGDAASVFVFQAFALTTASTSRVVLGGTVNACNVFWQVASDVTLGTGSHMVGTVMAMNSITATTGADVQGRLLARTGAVTLDSNTITAARGCDQTSTAATIARLNAEAATAAQAAADAATATAAQQAADEAARVAAAAALADKTAADQVAARELASTGFDATGLVVGTLALLASGTFLVLLGRRQARRR
ncbi:ice-binding family protein [Naasia lichenicola]|uniref:ice-binding family protein n=1 Tax=Naasia lichenicola TaxID=2565933 RepID=UPI00130D9C6C|nr:ice-binding family protein [Naasia lichenicola]